MHIRCELDVFGELQSPEHLHAVVILPRAVRWVLPHEPNSKPVVVVAEELRQNESCGERLLHSRSSPVSGAKPKEGGQPRRQLLLKAKEPYAARWPRAAKPFRALDVTEVDFIASLAQSTTSLFVSCRTVTGTKSGLSLQLEMTLTTTMILLDFDLIRFDSG